MPRKAFQRQQFHTLKARLEERRRFIQVLAGPRQVGKSTRTVFSARRWRDGYSEQHV